MIRVITAFSQRSLRSRAVLVGIALAASALVAQAQVFSAPQNLSHSGTAEFAQIAVDSSGNINVVWDDFIPGNNDIFFSRSTDGGVTFSTPKNLSNNAGSSVFPQIAVDSGSNINIVWEDNTPGNFNIFFCRSNDGGLTFTTPENLSNIAGVSVGAQIAVDPSGNINVVWEDFTGFEIFFSRSTDGGVTFSTPKNLSNNAGASGFPGVDAATNRGNIAVDSSGNINVVWDDFTPGNPDIFFTRSTDGGATLSTPKNLSNNVGSSVSSQIAVDSSGNINVVWVDNTPGNAEIFFSRSNDGGVTFSAPKNLSNNAGLSGSPEEIAVDSRGNINVVWVDNTPGNFDIFFTRSADGGTTFSTPKNLSNDASSSGDVQIVVDPSGNINVVWGSQTSGGIAGSAVLFANSTDGGTSFSSPKNLSDNAFQPQIAVGPGGSINVIWDNFTSPPASSDIFYTGSVSPTVTSVFPSSGIQGQNITDFTVTGTDFDSSAVLSFSGTGIVVNSYSSRTATQIVASITIAGNAGIGPRDVIVANPGVQQATLSGAFTILQSAVMLPDLSITSVEPVQVVFRPDMDHDGETDLVLNKSTAVLVTVHVDNPSALKQPVSVALQFQGQTLTQSIQPSELDSAGNVVVIYDLTPLQAGLHQQITAQVDPTNTVPETNENNNTFPSPPLAPLKVSVRNMRTLQIPYVLLTNISSCIFPNCYGALDPVFASQSFAQSKDFILATYPVPQVQSQVVGTLEGSSFPGVGLDADMATAYRIGMRVNPAADRVVTLVPSDYFNFHLLPYAGFSKPGVKAVLSSVVFFSVPAHEIAHTYGLHLPTIYGGPGEEYQTNDPGICASGMWVDRQNQPISDGFCFMGSVPQTATGTFTFIRSCVLDPNDPIPQNTAQINRHAWIDKADYESLFASRLLPTVDPEIVIVTGLVGEDDTVTLFPWYVAAAGNSTVPTSGNYSIELVDQNGQITGSSPFPVSFAEEGDFAATPVHTGRSLFAFSLPLPTGLFTVRIRHLSKVLLAFDLSTKLLQDAINAIPDRGFLNDPIQRRSALLNKVQALEHMITAQDFAGAQAKLQNDLKPTLIRWILDSYPIHSPLEFTKKEALNLVDEVGLRLLTAQ